MSAPRVLCLRRRSLVSCRGESIVCGLGWGGRRERLGAMGQVVGSNSVGVGLAVSTSVLWAISPMFMASVGRRIGSFPTNLWRGGAAGGGGGGGGGAGG